MSAIAHLVDSMINPTYIPEPERAPCRIMDTGVSIEEMRAEGISYQEIAEDMEISVSSAMSYLTKYRRMRERQGLTESRELSVRPLRPHPLSARPSFYSPCFFTWAGWQRDQALQRRPVLQRRHRHASGHRASDR